LIYVAKWSTQLENKLEVFEIKASGASLACREPLEALTKQITIFLS
jgi:hypothetical protein